MTKDIEVSTVSMENLHEALHSSPNIRIGYLFKYGRTCDTPARKDRGVADPRVDAILSRASTRPDTGAL